MYLFSLYLSIFLWQLSLFTTNSAECMGTENISWKWKFLGSLEDLFCSMSFKIKEVFREKLLNEIK